jgi:hypothetical protein
MMKKSEFFEMVFCGAYVATCWIWVYECIVLDKECSDLISNIKLGFIKILNTIRFNIEHF